MLTYQSPTARRDTRYQTQVQTMEGSSYRATSIVKLCYPKE